MRLKVYPAALPGSVEGARRAWAKVRGARRATAVTTSSLPPAGFPPGAPAGHVEHLTDEELALVNELLPWRCFTIDSQGRRLGDRARPGKRENPQPIPDARIDLADERFGLAGKHVLEVGCFEGVHTIALCRRAAQVTAVDSRIVNVVKTIVRCGLYGERPRVVPCNIVDAADDLAADVVFHVGVLYHLHDPVRHLIRLGELCRVGLLLDSHVARDDQATETMEIDGRRYRYRPFGENPGPDRVFAGMYDESRWLLLDDIVGLLERAGFAAIEVVDQREERNGRRMTLLASKAPAL